MANNVEINITAADNTGQAFNTVTKKMENLSRDMGKIGNTMTRAFTNPLKKLGKELMKNDEFAAAFAPIQEAFGALSDQLAVSLIPVLEKLTPFFMNIADAISNVITWFDGLDPKVKNIITGFTLFVGVLGPLILAIGGLVAIATPIVAVLGTVAAAVGTTVGGLVAAAAAIAVMVGAWAATLYTWYSVTKQNVEFIIETLGGFVEKIIVIGRNIGEGLINGIKEKIGEAVSAVTELATNIINAAKSILGIASPSTVFLEVGRNLVEGLIKGIMETPIGQAFLDIIATVNEFIKGLSNVTIEGIKLRDILGEIAAYATLARVSFVNMNAYIQGTMIPTFKRLNDEAISPVARSLADIWSYNGRQVVMDVSVNYSGGGGISTAPRKAGAAGAANNKNAPVDRFASGGSVTGGKTVLVGERGPELFTPPSDGYITPSNKLGGVTLHVHYSPAISLATEHEVKNTLLPFVRDALRNI